MVLPQQSPQVTELALLAARPMKPLFITLAGAFCVTACIDIPYKAQTPPPTGIRYDPNVFVAGIATMSDTELERQKGLARSGDKRAAFNVYSHYWSAGNDKVKAMEWLKYTAELGHGSAQYILAQNYIHNGDTPSAIYWAKRSRDSGYPNGAALVESLENP